MGPIPADDTIPIQISDTLTRGTVKPTYPVLQYPHRPGGGDAIANGFIYRGKQISALWDKLVFGDITTGRIWYADRADLVAADDARAETLAPIHEMETGLRGIVEQVYRSRGGKGETLPGASQISGRGRVDLRFAIDDAGELYLLTKPDGMIRKVVGATVVTAPAAPPASTPASAAAAPAGSPVPATGGAASAMKNPVPSTPASIAEGKSLFEATCASCHGRLGQGALKEGITISIIEEQRGKQPPDLTDAQWDHGSSDGEIFSVMTRGIPSTMMPPFAGPLSDTDMWNIVNYLRTLTAAK